MEQIIKMVKFVDLDNGILPFFYTLTNDSQYKKTLELERINEEKLGLNLIQMNNLGYKLETFATIIDDKKISHQVAIFTKIDNQPKLSPR